MKPVVAIVGRPNVGKSTLFNKLIGRHKAIVYDEPGVTRDLNYADIEEGGRAFTLVDTGGFEARTADVIIGQVREETQLAIEEADLIILLMDGRTGATGEDRDLVEILRRAGKPVVYAVNKIDSERQRSELVDFYSLGLSQVLPVSAESGTGVVELIDTVIEKLPAWEEAPVEEDRTRVALVGRPNVGKSSILNRLIGRKRALVSDIPGTTRDPIDAPYEREDKKYLFIDTAGIRKKNKVSLKIETYCVMEAIKSIDRCDAAVLVIDAREGVQGQDEKIAGIIEDRKKCCVIVINKWDIIEKDTHSVKNFTEAVREKLHFVSFAPVLFVSALTGQRVVRIFDAVDEVVQKSRTQVPTSALNDALQRVVGMYHPPVYRGREVKLNYITQVSVSPPSFIIFTNYPEGVKDSYKRYIISGLREALGLDTCPVRLLFRKKN